MAILKDLIVQNAARVIGPVYANSFVKAGGTSSQFLKADGSVDTNTYALSSNIPSFNATGNATQPVYLSATNTFATCTTYAGGTAVTLNGTSASGDDISIYAPTSTGTSGQFLKWPASGSVPTWADFSWDNGSNFAFKTISTANDSTTSGISGNAIDVVANSNTATLTIKGGNNWIHSTGDNHSKIITISHLVPRIGEEAKTIYKITWDDAGHISNAARASLSDLIETHRLQAGDIIIYDGSTWTNTVPSDSNTDYVYICSTSANIAAKTATSKSTNVPVAYHYYWVYISSANSASSALTFKANNSTAYPIYINGTASSSSNNTLPVGLYFVYYSGSAWYFNTDGTMTISGNQFDGDALSIVAQESVTYSQLTTLISQNNLIPGKQYRITDYVTTTKTSSTYSSAGHAFDLIVTAIDWDKLDCRRHLFLNSWSRFGEMANLV